MLKRILMIVGGLFACIAVCGSTFYISSVIYCQRRNMPPTAPVYPGSFLVHTSVIGVRKDFRFRLFEESPAALVTYHYLTTDHLGKVFKFYSQKADYLSGWRSSIPTGYTDYQGRYFVYLNGNAKRVQDKLYEYVVEIHWEPC